MGAPIKPAAQRRYDNSTLYVGLDDFTKFNREYAVLDDFTKFNREYAVIGPHRAALTPSWAEPAYVDAGGVVRREPPRARVVDHFIPFFFELDGPDGIYDYGGTLFLRESGTWWAEHACVCGGHAVKHCADCGLLQPGRPQGPAAAV